MIREIREFYCPLCGYIRRLDLTETIEVCPACQDGKGQVYQTAYTDLPRYSTTLHSLRPTQAGGGNEGCPFIGECAAQCIKACTACHTDGHWYLYKKRIV